MSTKYFIFPRIPSWEGTLSLGGDKSITHRAIILSSLCRGKVRIKNPLICDDTLATLGAFEKMGIKYEFEKGGLVIEGRGKRGLKAPSSGINCRDSGTTIRLLAGLLSAQKFPTLLRSRRSLSSRPMLRITRPLRLMGADIHGRRVNTEEHPPLKIEPVRRLTGIDYRLPVPSAQVKSCILLASLYAQGITRIRESYKSRDHTERFLKFMGAKIKIKNNSIFIENSSLRNPGEVFVPSDISTASYFLAVSLLVKNSRLLIKDVCLNPTRAGFLDVLRRMGADIKIYIKESIPEVYGDVEVANSCLKSIQINKEEIPRLIDELPLFMVLATQSQGESVINNCGELKVKETDRINSMVYNLKRMGAKIKVIQKKGDYFVYIKGPVVLKGTFLKSFSDHRTFLSLFVASQVCKGACRIDHPECVSKSFPYFFRFIKRLVRS